jgi:hypothetical protein
MTATAFAKLLHARKTGRGKWTAKCPSHDDRRPSLSIAEGKRGVLIRCMSNGCDTRDILRVLGLGFSDLFYDKATPAIRAHLSLRDEMEDLEDAWQSARLLAGLEPEKRKYWLAVQKKAYDDLQLIRCRIEPLVVYREWRSRKWQCMNLTQRTKVLEDVWQQLSR